MTLLERFEDRFIKLSSCWEWIRCKDKDGYGAFAIKKKTYKAHRMSYQLYVGPIPDGLLVCHKCDNPGCVNPDHLFLGTCKQNLVDAAKKDRMGTRTLRGSIITPEDRLMIKSCVDFGITQKEIAEQFGISTTSVTRIYKNNP